MTPVEKYRQECRQARVVAKAQAGFDLLVGIVKWAGLLAFLIWWTRV